jgi:hypothetical protein
MTLSTPSSLETEIQQSIHPWAWFPELGLLLLSVLGGWALVSVFGLPAAIAPRTPTATLLRDTRQIERDQLAQLRALQQLEAAQKTLLERNRELAQARQQYETLEQKRTEAVEQHAAAVLAVLRNQQQTPAHPFKPAAGQTSP